MIISLLAFRRVLRDRPPTCLTGRRGVDASLDPAADISAGFSLHLLFGVWPYVAVTVVPAGRERALGPHGSTRNAAPRARRGKARPLNILLCFYWLRLVSAVASAAVTAAAAPSPALRVAALAAVTTAAAPPFSTAVEVRPAARRMQDFAECPVLTHCLIPASSGRPGLGVDG